MSVPITTFSSWNEMNLLCFSDSCRVYLIIDCFSFMWLFVIDVFSVIREIISRCFDCQNACCTHFEIIIILSWNFCYSCCFCAAWVWNITMWIAWSGKNIDPMKFIPLENRVICNGFCFKWWRSLNLLRIFLLNEYIVISYYELSH